MNNFSRVAARVQRIMRHIVPGLRAPHLSVRPWAPSSPRLGENFDEEQKPQNNEPSDDGVSRNRQDSSVGAGWYRSATQTVADCRAAQMHSYPFYAVPCDTSNKEIETVDQQFRCVEDPDLAVAQGNSACLELGVAVIVLVKRYGASPSIEAFLSCAGRKNRSVAMTERMQNYHRHC